MTVNTGESTAKLVPFFVGTKLQIKNVSCIWSWEIPLKDVHLLHTFFLWGLHRKFHMQQQIYRPVQRFNNIIEGKLVTI